ncbi:MAG: hypothetical protein ACT4PX_00160 [Actinomycetota bacterium]
MRPYDAGRDHRPEVARSGPTHAVCAFVLRPCQRRPRLAVRIADDD